MNETYEAISEQAKRAYKEGKYQLAGDLFQKAEDACNAAEKPLDAAEMANNRSVALLQAGDAHGALAACLDTDKVFSRAGDTRREGLALGNQAAAYKELGHKKESLRLFKQSAECLEKAGDRDNLAVVLNTSATLEMESGDQIGAMSSMLDAMRLAEKLTWRQKIMRWLFSLVAKLMPK